MEENWRTQHASAKKKNTPPGDDPDGVVEF
jgi:hypothetical protein